MGGDAHYSFRWASTYSTCVAMYARVEMDQDESCALQCWW